MKPQFIGALLLLLVIGHEAANIRRSLNTNRQTRAAIRHHTSAKGKIVNDLKEIDLPMIVDLLMGEICVLIGDGLATKLDKIYEEGMAEKPALDSAPPSFLEKHGKVRTTTTNHIVTRHHGKSKIAVVDDILALLALVGAGLALFRSIKDFLNGGISAEKREAFEAWLGTGEAALETSKTKLRQFEKWFTEHGATAKDSDIIADLASLSSAVEALSDKVGVIKSWMQKAVDEANWEYKTSTNVIFGILTIGIWNAVDKTTQRVNINGHQNKAFCAGEALPALVARVSLALNALHTDVTLVMAS